MKRFVRTIWRWFVSWNVGLFSALISLFAFRLPFIISFLIGVSVGMLYSLYMKKKEKKHITYPSKDERMKEAKKKGAENWAKFVESSFGCDVFQTFAPVLHLSKND